MVPLLRPLHPGFRPGARVDPSTQVGPFLTPSFLFSCKTAQMTSSNSFSQIPLGRLRTPHRTLLPHPRPSFPAIITTEMTCFIPASAVKTDPCTKISALKGGEVCFIHHGVLRD